MKVVVTAHDLALGGTQTYALTVAEQLQRLGHDAILHAAEGGAAGRLAEERGLTVAETEADLPGDPDVVLAQDSMMSYRMADRFPETPQLFRCPNAIFDLQMPPQLPGIVGALVVLSERFARRLRALAVTQDIVRMRQPVDTDLFAERSAIRDRPRRALLIGNYLHGQRRRMLIDAWESAGVECSVAGGQASITATPETAMADADIVVAKGKAALEAMACGRAVYVYDQYGCDGWVSPDTYPAFEADNFAGLATDRPAGPRLLLADLEGYRPEMGPQNRDLVVRHHGARAHAESLVAVMRQLAPRAPQPGAPYRELARLVRLGWETERRAHQRGVENTALHERLLETEALLAGSEAALGSAERRYLDLVASRRYRAGAQLGRLADTMRGRT